MGTINFARNAEIVRRRMAGEWPCQIAEAMSLSRNVVIGVLNRAGKCSPDTDKSPIQRARCARGEAHPNASLTASEVAAIRREYAPYDRRFGATALAAQYRVHPETVRAIVHGRNWRPAQ